MNASTTLSNRFYRSEFDPRTGDLLSLQPHDEPQSLVQSINLQYRAQGQLYSQNRADPLACPPQVLSVRRLKSSITSTLQTPHVRITRRFELDPRSPLLCVRYEFTGRKACQLHGPSILYLHLAADLNDVTRDEKDLYFDGAELGSRRELPCWRVLYRAGHQRGLLVATRSKQQMSHLMYVGQTIEVRPHVYSQQQIDYSQRELPVHFKPGTRYVAEFEIGPWSAPRHMQLLRAAHLDKPVRVPTPVTPAPARRNLRGTVLWLADLAPPRDLASTFHTKKWIRLGLPWNPKRPVLVANTGSRPPAFTIKPNLAGPCRVYVGASRSASVGLQFSGDPYPIYRMGIHGTAFHSVLYGPSQTSELDFGVVNMTGRTVRVVPNHNGHWPARLDYLRLEPLPPAAAKTWLQRQSLPRRTLLAGIPDCGDVFFYLLDRHNLDPRLLQGNMWEQARIGFNRFYWQMHGSYTGYHTKIGTQMPMVCKAHGAFEPQSKGGVLFYREHDVLKLAVDTCKQLGVEMWGAIRLNAYMSGKRDDFFRDHPHYGEVTEDGTFCGNKICYAFPEVRAYQRLILVEAAQYGLQGLMLGFLRHPPILLYHPLLVSGYRARYGKLPPRSPGAPDQFFKNSLPHADPAHLQWYAYRAEFMTQFGRDLKRDLRAKGLGHVKISLWLRPNHCLFDGINIADWLKEDLCDEVIADIVSSDAKPQLDEPTPAWRKMVQAKVPLLKGIGPGGYVDYVTKNIPRYRSENYAGFCAYGSEQVGQTTAELAMFDLLK